MADSIAPLIDRLDVAEARLAALSRREFPPGQTDPDPGGEETWDAARVWAHMGEFLAYWTSQAREIVASPAGDVPPFGRMKTDPTRVEPIERDRLLPADQLWQRLDDGIARSRDLFTSFSDAELDRTGVHPVFGEQPVRFILGRFVVVHLEEHADQLDKLAKEAAEAEAEVQEDILVLGAALTAAVENNHRALDLLVRSEGEAMKKMFSHRDDVTLAHPLGLPAVGWAQVEAALDLAVINLKAGEPIRFEPISAYETPDLAYTVEIERWNGNVPTVPMALRATTIFRLEDGEWRVAHRHADPITTPRPIASIIDR